MSIGVENGKIACVSLDAVDPSGSVRAAEVTADNVHSLAFPVSRATVAARALRV